MGKITSIILLLFLILLLSEASKAMTCEDLFRENQIALENSVQYFGERIPLYSHRASEQSGIERMSFVGQSPKIRINANEVFPEQIIKFEIENILTSTGAGQTRLQLNVESRAQTLEFFGKQSPELFVSSGIQVKQPTNLVSGTSLTEVYKIKSEQPKGTLVLRVHFKAVSNSAGIAQISTIDGERRMARNLQPSGKAADWQLLGATLHFEIDK